MLITLAVWGSSSISFLTKLCTFISIETTSCSPSVPHMHLILLLALFWSMVRFLNLNPTKRAFNLLQSFTMLAKKADFLISKNLICISLLVYFFFMASVGLFKARNTIFELDLIDLLLYFYVISSPEFLFLLLFEFVELDPDLFFESQLPVFARFCL